MNKSYFILILFILLSLNLFAQYGFKYNSSIENTNQRIPFLLEKEGGNFLLVIKNEEQNNYHRFINLSPLGEFISEYAIELDTVSNRFTVNVFELSGAYFLLGFDEENFVLYKLSDSFELIEKKVYPYTGRPIRFLSAKLENDSNLSFSGSTSFENMIIGGKINLLTDEYIYTINEEYLDFIVNDYDLRLDSTGYILYGQSTIYFTDSLFNIKTEVREDGSNTIILTQQGSIFTLTDSTFLISGKYGWIEQQGIVAGIFDNEFKVKDYDTLVIRTTDEGDASWPAPFKSLGIDRDNGYFYVGGSYLNDFSHHPFGTNPSPFLLAKYRISPFEQIWEETYSDDAYYYMLGLMATTDGGCLMYGFKANDTINVLEAYALKVNAGGLVTGETYIPLPNKDILLFPNPTTGIVNIQSEHDEAIQIYIYDSVGKLLFQKYIPDLNSSLDLTFLSTGVFVYNIKNENGDLIKSGKIMKAR